MVIFLIGFRKRVGLITLYLQEQAGSGKKFVHVSPETLKRLGEGEK